MALVPSENLIGEGLASSHQRSVLSAREALIQLIRSEDLKSSDAKARIADALFVFQQVLTKREYEQLRGSLDLDQDHATWPAMPRKPKS